MPYMSRYIFNFAKLLIFQHLFACQGVDEFMKDIVKAGYENVGVVIRISKNSMSLSQFMVTRLGRCG